MGTNKTLLKINNQTLIQRQVELLEKIFVKVVLSVNETELYKFTNKEIVKDILPGRGPLSGIYSCLKASNSEMNFFLSCDIPFVSQELIGHIINFKSDSEIILPKSDGKVQQLCGLYSKKVIGKIEGLLEESNQKNSGLKGSIFELLERVDHEEIEVMNEEFYHSNLFLNINTPEDYNYAKKLFEQN
jgi:molybdopterin-guanine dinucleotide biosynthesis protein A